VGSPNPIRSTPSITIPSSSTPPEPGHGHGLLLRHLHRRLLHPHRQAPRRTPRAALPLLLSRAPRSLQAPPPRRRHQIRPDQPLRRPRRRSGDPPIPPPRIRFGFAPFSPPSLAHVLCRTICRWSGTRRPTSTPRPSSTRSLSM
jgi:hypothetical protein